VAALANTGEVRYPSNRSGNRPSHEGAHVHVDRAIALCQRAGFRLIAPRGDTDFSPRRRAVATPAAMGLALEFRESRRRFTV
jgi:hypothetical protein